MTLRDYLETRGREGKWITLALLFPAGIVWLTASAYAWAGYAALFIFLAVMHIRATAIPCPRCKKSLGKLGYRYFIGAMRRARGYDSQLAEEARKCPHCGLRLDEEIEPSAPRPA